MVRMGHNIIDTRDDASIRFSLLELDDTPQTPEVVTPEPVQPVVEEKVVEPDPEPVVAAGEISQVDRVRAVEDEKAAEKAGFTLAPPVYAIGTRVNSMGVENFRLARQEFDEMAGVDEACGQLIDQIASERRVDTLVEVPQLHMLDDGGLHTNGNGTYPLSRRAFQGLCGFTTPGGAGYLAECEPQLRAHNLNHWFDKGFRVDARATKKARKEDPEAGDVIIPKEVTLRTRDFDGQREIFSVVGPRYGEHDIDKIAQQIIDGCPPNAKCDITYDGYKARVNVLFHTNIEPANAVAGEIFRAGALITTADDGSGSIKISAQLWRNLCLNLIIIDNARDLVTSRRHVGQGIADSVAAGLDAAMQKVEHFMVKWNKMSVENILDEYGVQDIDRVLRALVFNKIVYVPGVGRREMYERLHRAWEIEASLGSSMYSRTTIINAITRAAHTEEWKAWTTTEELERTAGQLLYARRLNLDITDEQAELFG
jgi:hypothetical protein